MTPLRFDTKLSYETSHGFTAVYLGDHPNRENYPHIFTAGKQLGVFFLDDNGKTEYTDWTIREVKPKITRWMNVYQNGTSQILWSGSLFEEKSEAETDCKRMLLSSTNKRIARIKVEFEEGEGL